MDPGSTSLDVTDPTWALSPRRTIEITAISRLNDSPLVVIELPAHRSDAADLSATITMVSSALPKRAASLSSNSMTSGALIISRVPTRCGC